VLCPFGQLRPFDHAEDVGIENDSMLHRLKPGKRRLSEGPVSGHVPSGRKVSDVVQPSASLDSGLRGQRPLACAV